MEWFGFPTLLAKIPPADSVSNTFNTPRTATRVLVYREQSDTHPANQIYVFLSNSIYNY